MTLGFLQLCLVGLFQTLVPYVYLATLAGGDQEVAKGLENLQHLSAVDDPLHLNPRQLEERANVMRPLFERVPWTTLAFVASLLIYPVLGRLAARFSARPESAGLLILLSVATGQNPAMVPLGLQVTGLGQIGLPLGTVLGLLLMQFGALAAGIFSDPKTRAMS